MNAVGATAHLRPNPPPSSLSGEPGRTQAVAPGSASEPRAPGFLLTTSGMPTRKTGVTQLRRATQSATIGWVGTRENPGGSGEGRPSKGSPCRERRPEARLRDRPGDDLLGDRLRGRARQAGDRPQPGERADHAVGRPLRRRERDRRQHRQGVGQGRAAPGRLAGQAAHGRPALRLRARGAGLQPRGHLVVHPPQGRRRRRGRARGRDDHRRRDHLPGLLRHRRARGDRQRRPARRA